MSADQGNTVKLNVELPKSSVEVDSSGRVIIKNGEFADKVKEFLSSPKNDDFAKAEYFLLCCTF